MASVAYKREGGDRNTIPVRGHRFWDWLSRWGTRLSFEGLEDPPRNKRIAAGDHLRVEISLPGFRAQDIEVIAEAGCLEVSAQRSTVEDAHNSEMRVARLALSLGEQHDPERASADFRRGLLVVKVPVGERAKVLRIPVVDR